MQNSVELIGYYGGDYEHALSAWTSTRRELTEEKEHRIGALLKLLAESDPPHGSPFEKSFLHFLVVCDTASHIHLLKHRIGVSINAESARYKELKEDKYHIPYDWPEATQEIFENYAEESYKMYHTMLEHLIEDVGMDRKRAKESARYCLLYANQLTLDIGFNFRSFMHFQNLRNKPEAQSEIREIANEMLKLVRKTGSFDLSLEAFGY